MTRLRFAVGASAGALLALACGRPAGEESSTSGGAAGKAAGAVVPFSAPGDAREQLDRFLARAVEGAPRDTSGYAAVEIADCIPSADAWSSYWVADHRILSLSPPRGDTLDAVAEVVTVAEQVPDGAAPYESVVRARVRRDTLRWRMERDPADGRWRVCGWAHDEHDLGGYGRPDNVRYEPDGTTREALLARVDSIRRARRP